MPHECTTCRRVFPDGSKEMLSGCPDCGGNKFQFRPSGGGGASGDEAAEEPPEPPEPSSTAEALSGRSPPGASVAETVAGATERVRNLVGGDDPQRAGGGDRADAAAATDAEVQTDAGTGDEDTAQASARSSVVGPDELPDPADSEVKGVADLQRPTAGAPEVRPEDGADDVEGAADAPGKPAADAGGSAAEDRAARTAATDADDAESAPFTGTPEPDDSPDLAELREELNQQFESIRIVDRGQYELNLMELYDREEYIISLMEDGRYAIEVPETWRDD